VQRWSTPASCGTPRRRLPARSRRDVGGPQAGSRPAGPETQRGRGRRGRGGGGVGGRRGRGAAGSGGGGIGGRRDRGRSDPALWSGGGTRRDPAGQGSPGSRRHRPPGARGPAPLPPSSSLAAPAGPAVPAVADLPLDGPHLARRRPGDRRAAGAEGGWPSLGQAPEAGRDGAPGGVSRPDTGWVERAWTPSRWLPAPPFGVPARGGGHGPVEVEDASSTGRRLPPAEGCGPRSP
jgi:hypothetical protein